MKKPPEKKVVPKNEFHCEACRSFGMSPSQFKDHLRNVHKITDLQGTKKMLMHVDGRDWFGYKWEWEIGGMRFQQDTVNKRSKEDQMYWD